MGKMIDITGQRFGKLSVIDCAGKLDGRRYFWNCKCDCGKIIQVLGASLRSGNTKSCGCGKYDGLKNYNKEQSVKNEIPAGTRFGKLVVEKSIGYKQQVEGHSRLWYQCKCDCGNIKEAMGNMLKQGQINSCGKCNLNSIGEYEIMQLLEENKINYQHDCVFTELFQETGRRLRFDFIIYDKDFIKPIRFIEFDGRQHSEGPMALWKQSYSLEDIQERDNIKNNFCLLHGYPLVRIPCNKLHRITLNDLLGDKYLIKGDDLL